MADFFAVVGGIGIVVIAYWVGWQRGLQHMAEHVVRTRRSDGQADA